MDHDRVRLLPPLRLAALHLRHVPDGRLAGGLPHRHRPPARDGEQSADHGHGRHVQLLPRQRQERASDLRLPAVLRSRPRPCKSHSRTSLIT